MSIFTKLKTATDFSASVIKEGFALIWPEKKSDGSVALQVKLEDGSVHEIGGGGTVDESRLLPENPGDGDVPVFNATATTGGGNDETVKLLIQPSTSENQIVDSAAGNVVPVSLSIEGDITVSEEGIMQFTQSQTISVPMAFSTVEMITGNSEWCLDFEFIPPTDLNDDNEFWSLYNDQQSYVGFWRGSMSDIVHMPCFGDIPGFTRGEKHLLTFEQWKDGETWKLSGYHNGSIAKTSNVLIPATTSQDISFGHGNKRKFKGQIVSIRFRNVAPYRGTSFQPDATPYAVPQIAGAWRTKPAKELMADAIDESRLLPENPANGDIPCFDATATTGGGNDANTKALIHFDTEVKDEAAGNTAPLALSSLNATIDTTVSKFGSGSLKLTSGHVFVPISDLTAVNCVISCWVYLDSLPSSYSPLFCQDDDAAGGWNLAVDNRGIYMFCRGGATKAKQPLQAKTWYWAAIVKSGKELRFYLNGAYIYSLTDSILRFTSPIIGIGEQINEDGRKLTGNVDEFRIQFLTADELSAWTGLTIPVPVEAYSVAQTVGEWGKLNKSALVQSVNGVVPDELGNVDTPSIDESRLLPETRSVSSDSVGNPVIFKAISRIDNTYWLCLPLNEDTNDRSTYGVTTGVYGTVNIVSNAPSSPGGSAFFNGSSCLHGTLPAQLGTADFTVRFWMMAPEISGSAYPRTMFSTRHGDATSGNTFALHGTENGKLFIYSDTDITSRTDTPFTLQSNVWYHVAVVRKSGVVTLYVDGNIYSSGSFTNSLTRQIFGLGASWTGSSYSEAGTVYMTSLDVLNYAAYDGAFTTPAYQPGILAGMGYAVATDSEVADILSVAGIGESRLLPDPNAVSDKSVGLPVVMAGENNTDDTYILRMPLATDVYDYSLNEVAINNTQVELQPDVPSGKGNSAYFNGNQSCLLGTLPIAFGTSDFTIDVWVKLQNNNNSDPCVFTTRDGDTTSADAFQLGVVSSGSDMGKVYIYSNTYMTSPVSEGYAAFTFGNWHHIRMIRSSNALKIYLDGKLHAEGTCTNNWSRTIFTIGTLYRSGRYWGQSKGYISSLEVVNYAKPLEEFEPVFTYGVLTDKKFRVGTPEEVKKALWISDVWTVLEDTANLVLSSKNGNLQKITLSQACTITAPVLDADHPTLLLQATSSNNVMLGDTQIWSSVGTFQIGWYWDGETTRRYGVVEVQ